MNGFTNGEENPKGSTVEICCLNDNGDRCFNVAGNSLYSQRIQKKRLNLSLDDTAPHYYICDYHERIIQCAKDWEEEKIEEIDLHQLPMTTLRRYQRRYGVQARPGISKAQLADKIKKHFKTIPVKENDVLAYFIYTIKSNGNKLDQKNGLNSNDEI